MTSGHQTSDFFQKSKKIQMFLSVLCLLKISPPAVQELFRFRLQWSGSLDLWQQMWPIYNHTISPISYLILIPTEAGLGEHFSLALNFLR